MEMICSPYAAIIFTQAKVEHLEDWTVRLSLPSSVVNQVAIEWAKNEAGMNAQKETCSAKGVFPLWGYHYDSWFKNWDIPVMGTVTFGSGGADTEVTEWVMDLDEYGQRTDVYWGVEWNY